MQHTFSVGLEHIFQDSGNIQPRIYQHDFENIITGWFTADKILFSSAQCETISHRAVFEIDDLLRKVISSCDKIWVDFECFLFRFCLKTHEFQIGT